MSRPFGLWWILLLVLINPLNAQNLKDGLESNSDFSRSMASQAVRFTQPTQMTRPRRSFPESDPHVCLAFLSCCGRTDLLNHTMAAAIRHMEEDEPSFLRYEIAWVDNGSGTELTSVIEDTYQIDHSLPMKQNTGLAYGMNLLIFNLCKAPYILLLEEDWLYLDDLVAPQTARRKHVVANALALTEQNITTFDGRTLMGVFLRPETYNAFLKFPLADVWETVTLDVESNLPKTEYYEEECDNEEGECKDPAAEQRGITTTKIEYQTFCSDPGIKTGNIWGSYTNGAGLYRRSYLADIGRMYGEPGDAFHDRYVEGNYAYRVGLKYCHAALRLGDCTDLADPKCTAAFYHIGGGRGTRPQKATNSKCAHELWNFWGTPIFEKFIKYLGGVDLCSREEIQELRDLKLKEKDSAQYRAEVERVNEQVFAQERAARNQMRQQAQQIRIANNDMLRQQVDWLAGKTDKEIADAADQMERLANSPHPLQGFWDSHGRPLK